MPLLNFHALRTRDPNDFENIVVLKTLDNGVMIYGGRLKNESATTPQTYRFPVSKFTLDEAKEWMTKHDIKYILAEKGGDMKEALMICREKIALEQKGTEWEITLIQAGTSINGFHYTDDLLKESIPLFEGIEVYAHKFGDTLDHRPNELSNPNGLILNKAGWIESVKFVSEDGKGKLKGNFKVINSTLADMLKNIWTTDKSKMPEFSVDLVGDGYVEEGIKHVTEFKKTHSLDIVSNASAGGKFERMVAGINIQKNKGEKHMDKLMEMLLAKVKEGVIKLKESIDGKNDEQISGMIQEALAVKKEDVKSPITEQVLEQIKGLPTMEAIKGVIADMIAKEKVMSDEEKKKEEERKKDEEKKKIAKESADSGVKEAIAEMQKTIDKMNGEKIINELLAKESSLDNASKNRIKKYFDGKVVTESAVSGEIVETKKYLEALGAEKKMTILESAGSVSVGDNRKDRLTKLLEIYLNPKLENTAGYENITHNMLFRNIGEAVSAFAGHSHFNGEQTIKEATTASFPYLFQDVMNKQVRKQYEIMYTEVEWRKLVEEVSIETLDKQHIYDIGGFNLLSTVAENGTYAALTAPSDMEATYTPLKKGNKFTITEEMLYTSGDKVNQIIRSIPNNMVASAKATISKYIFDLITGCDGSGGINQKTIYDSTALYTTSHGNLGASALSYSTFYSGYCAMANQTKLSTVLPTEIRPRFLLVPLELLPTAILICKTNTYPSATTYGVPLANPYAGLGVEPIGVPQYYLCSDTDNWYLIGDKNSVPTLQVGYFQNKRAPEILLQNQPTEGGTFTNDQWTWRVKWRFGAAITDYKPFYAGLVAGGGTA